MTFDVNKYYGVTITHGVKIGPKKWKSEAQVFRKDNLKDVGDKIFGIGTTMNTADTDASNNAKNFIYSINAPDDWKGQ